MVKQQNITLRIGNDTYISGVLRQNMVVLYSFLTKKPWSYAFKEKYGNNVWVESQDNNGRIWYVLWPEKIGPQLS